jgi:hypothetical protein
LPPEARDNLRHEFPQLFERTNPIIRHTIRCSRQMLEQQGLLKPIPVTIHPQPALMPTTVHIDNNGLKIGLAFDNAYKSALEFCELYATTRRAAGFMKTILLRRIGSSVKAGLNTTEALPAPSRMMSITPYRSTFRTFSRCWVSCRIVSKKTG